MIEFEKLLQVFWSNQVLHNIHLNIAQGEVVVIIGLSVSGKSTLLRCINKLEEMTSGDLIVDGLRLNDPKVDERLIRQEAGWCSAGLPLPASTALENVMFGPLRVRGANKKRRNWRVSCWRKSVCRTCTSPPFRTFWWSTAAWAIARALAVKPKMMLFDEPTSRLDPELRHEVRGYGGFGQEGMTMVIVTDEIGFAEK
ncbi:ATP-binding cassette domain-containing protein [Escherichia coli]